MIVEWNDCYGQNKNVNTATLVSYCNKNDLNNGKTKDLQRSSSIFPENYQTTFDQ